MRIVHLAAVFGAILFASSAQAASNAELKQQVRETERAFAATMQARDHAAFTRFLSEQAIFFGSSGALRGKDAVAARWKPFFEAKEAPFSWEPEEVEVLDDGTLASSSGPVYDKDGKLVSRFSSIWRLEAPGQWRIIFDRGSPVCNCSK